MTRQFLIPWVMLAKLVVTNGQQPQQPFGLEHVDHFQPLFTYPTLPSQNSFGVNRLGPIYNHQILHPQYELLAQNSGALKYNFVNPHSFFQLHTHPFETFVLSTTSKTPTIAQPNTAEWLSATTMRFTTTTTTQPPKTTTNLLNSESITLTLPTQTSTIETPQTSKHVVESVKTYIVGSDVDQKQKMPDLNTLEKMDVFEPTIERFKTLKIANLKPHSSPTLSSTVVPTAQEVNNQITATTNAVPSMLLKIISLPTTSLPKMSDKAERTTLEEEKANFIHQLNSSNLESFLKSANFSTQETQSFLRQIEKVLEDELQKRLQERVQMDTNARQDRENLIPTTSTPSDSIQPIESVAKVLNNEGHQLKTADTRLNYESAEIALMPKMTNLVTTTSSSNQVTASAQNAAFADKSTKKIRLDPVFDSLDKVRQQEQKEFDRLLGQIVLEVNSDELDKSNEEAVDQSEDDDLLPLLSTQQPIKNNFNRMRIQATRHPPKTNFHQLVQDYQYRLIGNIGFNELIKALRNAHIGFFNRSKEYKAKVRIN